MKFRAIFAMAVLMLVSIGSANAALTTQANPGSATAAFVFLDTDTATSYTVDTGITLSSLFTPQTGGASTGFSINVLSILGIGPMDLLDGSGGGFDWSFVGGVVGNAGTGVGYDLVGLGGYVAGFEDPDMPPMLASSNTTNQTVDNLQTLFDGTANTTGSAASGENGAFDGAAWGGNFGNAISENAFTSGNTMTLWGYADTFDGSALGVEIVALGTLVLDQLTGQLTYTPVPVPAAVWFLGSALLGLVGFSRRKSVQSVQLAA